MAVALVLVRHAGFADGRDDWAEKWCELNDCHGIKAAEQARDANAKVEREFKKAQRRYEATGEIRAVKSEAVLHALFQYDGPTIDHPAFPGVAAEHGERAERRHEQAAIEYRKEVEQRAIAPPTPSGGYLLPGTETAKGLAVRDDTSSAVGAAKRRHTMMTEELRMGCMYEYGQTPDGHGGYIMGRITTLKEPVRGCAAGSVWKDQGGGGVRLASRTAESAQSVWRKVNGTDREWFEDIEDLPKGFVGPPTHDQVRAKKLKPYKTRAPPPCAPGYGGAFCKRELGTGGDYVDREDTPPPWAQMKDVARLKAFWKEQHALSTGQRLDGVNLLAHKQEALPLAPGEYTAGTADQSKDPKDDCVCEPSDFECIKRCTQKSLEQPKSCFQKCDETGCYQECVHVEMSFKEEKTVKDAKKVSSRARARARAQGRLDRGRTLRRRRTRRSRPRARSRS